MQQAFRYDISQVGKLTRTDEGYLRGDVVLTRTGVFEYQLPNGSVRRELRHPDDVFHADAIASLRNIPVTNNHPSSPVTVDNAKELSVGFTGENIKADGSNVVGRITVTTKDGIEAAEMGNNQLSIGYSVMLSPESGVYNGERYDARQTAIKGNHVALCTNARAGSITAFNFDAADAVQIVEDNFNEKTEDPKMTEKLITVKLDGIDYQASPEVENALQRKNDDIGAKEKALNELQSKYDAILGERDSLTNKVDELKNRDLKADIADAVKSRVNLIEQVKDVLKDEKLDELSDLDIKKKVIETLSAKKTNLDDMSEDYINARFDTLLELRMDSAVVKNLAKFDAKSADEKSESINLDALRAESIQKLENRYKNK